MEQESEDDAAVDERQTRSVLYRAITRAHMLVCVVNEFPPGYSRFCSRCNLRRGHHAQKRTQSKERKRSLT